MANKTDLSDEGKLESSVEEQDEHMLGLLNSEVSDALTEIVREAIVESVGSLPLVTDQEKVRALTQKIERTSMRNIDVMETYSSRNIFTLRQYPRHQRMQILGEDLKETSAAVSPTTSEGTGNKRNEVDRYQSLPSILPKTSEMPSRTEMNELEDDLLQLKEKLNAARFLMNDAISKYQGVENTFTISNTAVNSFLEVSSEDISSPVRKVVPFGIKLQGLSNECSDMIRELDVTKQLRRSEEENDEIPTDVKKMKRKRLRMEEEYIIDRKVLQSKNVASLNTLRNLLK